MNDDLDQTTTNRSYATQNTPTGGFVPGQLVEKKFKIMSRLGSGGMGTVYRIEHIFLRREFALKTMDRHPGDDTMILRFQLEAKTAFAVNHPNLVKVHDFGIFKSGSPYIVMDLVDGITFADYLKTKGPLAFNLVAPLFVQACFGLMAAHEQSIVHRDIKPANLMLLNNKSIGSEGSVKLLDFGIAKLMTHEEGEIQALTRTGEFFGSPLYMSPEQCTGGAVDNRSDIYSLGCVLFEMLTGTPPHMGQNSMSTMSLHQSQEAPTLKEASLGHDYPEALERIVSKMLRKQPEHRYQNVGLIANDLTMFGAENKLKRGKRIAAATHKQPAEPEKLVSMSHWQLYALLAATGISAAVAGGLLIYFITSQHPLLTSTQPAMKQQSEVTSTSTAPATNEEQSAKSSIKQAEIPPEITETEIVIDGEKYHRYVFPDVSLGLITSVDAWGLSLPLKTAKGVVDVPAAKAIGLKIEKIAAQELLNNPSQIKRIPGKDFQGFFFTSPPDYLTVITDTQVMSSEKMASSLATILQNLKEWTNLQELRLTDCTLNRNSLLTVNNFKKLRILELELCKLDPQVLVKQPYLLNLTNVAFINCKFDTVPVIHELTKSRNLQILTLEKQVPIEALYDLKHCKHLTDLQISTKQIDDKTISAICELQQLKRLRFNYMTLNEKQLKMLIKCPNLQEIRLLAVTYGPAIERIQAMDPRINFAH